MHRVIKGLGGHMTRHREGAVVQRMMMDPAMLLQDKGTHQWGFS